MNSDFTYDADALNVHDGDTVTLAVDLGFGIVRKDHFRLFGPDPHGTMGLNAPELPTPEGKAAQVALAEKIALFNNKLLIATVKDRQEKYGRYLAVLFSPDGTVNINAWLVANGFAILKQY